MVITEQDRLGCRPWQDAQVCQEIADERAEARHEHKGEAKHAEESQKLKFGLVPRPQKVVPEVDCFDVRMGKNQADHQNQ